MFNASARPAARSRPRGQRPLRGVADSGQGQARGLLLAALGCLLVAGCVERRLTIRSDPPGALCVVDGRELGFTPVSTNFVYYATREVRLVKDGYETLTVLQPMKRPWWDAFPIEFFTENLIPRRFRDEREYSYQLQPSRLLKSDELYGRAEQLRQMSGHVAPAPAESAPPPELGPQVKPF